MYSFVKAEPPKRAKDPGAFRAAVHADPLDKIENVPLFFNAEQIRILIFYVLDPKFCPICLPGECHTLVTDNLKKPPTLESIRVGLCLDLQDIKRQKDNLAHLNF